MALISYQLHNLLHEWSKIRKSSMLK